MKKMNLSFLGLKAKMVLPLFLLIGLFLFSASSMNAQSPKKFAEKVNLHVQSLPMPISMALPTIKSNREAINNPKVTKDALVFLEKTYGEIIFSQIVKEGMKSKEAVEEAYKILNAKVPSEYLEPVKETYLEMIK